MRPIFRRCSARGAFVRNTRTMVQPAIEHALGLMLGACSFLLVGFDHACPRFGSRLESCLSPIRPGSSLAHVMPVPDSDFDSNHACPRFAQARAWPMSCLSPIRPARAWPMHACPRFGSRLESCLSPIRISTHGHAPHPPRSTARSSASVVPSPFASPLDVPHPPRSTARSSASRVAS